MTNYFNFIYELQPTDFFVGFVEFNDALKQSCNEEGESIGESNLQRVVEEAKDLFCKHTSWEGDGITYISALPGFDGNNYPIHFVVVKQYDNGTTFLASPIELEYLKEYMVQYSNDPFEQMSEQIYEITNPFDESNDSLF